MTDKKLAGLIDGLCKSESGVLATVSAITDDRSFVETDRFVGSDTELGKADGEGVVTGFATVGGQNVAVFATNPAVLKGSIGKNGADKIARVIKNAVKSCVPIIGILDTQGARFAEGIEAVEGYAKVLACISRAYGSTPIFMVNKGKNFGLSAYLCRICDVCIGYDKSELSTASPLIIAASAKADVNKTGTAQIHQKQTGVYTAVVKNDTELKNVLEKALELLYVTAVESNDDPNRTSAVLTESAKADVLIGEIFDKDSFFELRKAYAPEVVTGLARLDGLSVGVLAFSKNGTRIDTSMARKISDLFVLCNDAEIPLILLVDCAGSTVDIAEENDMLLREIARMIEWVGGKTSKIALITGSAVGLGYAAFASKSVADYTLAYPKAKIGAVESAAAAELLYGAEISKAKNKDAAAKKLEKAYAEENQYAVSVAKDGYIDNVIEPAFSRPYLIAALRMFADK